MVGARAISLVAVGMAYGLLTGCEGLIGLGEEPPPKKTAEACGLPPAKNLACTECMVDTCCEESRACMANAACADAAENCLPTCSDGGCPFTVCLMPLEGLEGEAHGLLGALIVCGTPCQAVCLPTPGSPCDALAKECCAGIEDETAHQSCVDAALGGDDELCESVRLQAESSLCPPN